MKTSTPPVLIAFALVCIALVQNTQAVSPPPDGGYPGGNTAEGQHALLALLSGTYNAAVGYLALESNTNGSFNTAVGAGTLIFDIGDENTAAGAGALLSNTIGANNTANGAFALFSNTSGSNNIAIGANAGLNLTTGSNNVDIGNAGFAGESDTVRIGDSQTTTFIAGISGDATFAPNRVVVVNGDSQVGSVDINTLVVGSRPNDNTAVGAGALPLQPTGGYNTAVGFDALSTDTGNQNTACGAGALEFNTSGENNTAIGLGALESNTTGNNNTAIGQTAGSGVLTASNVTCIGFNAYGADVSNTTWIANVYGVTTQSGTTAPVVVSDSGQLGTVVSSERFKRDIATMDKASEAVLSLRPVSFHYKSDTTDTPQFGLIAEEVAKVNPALVLSDKEGKPFTVRYDQVNAMLLNEFLKEHRKVQEQEATIAQLKKDFRATVAQLATRLDEQASQIQKVSTQLEASKPAPQVVLNRQ
jgi:trimeric autotransporter adhesin